MKWTWRILLPVILGVCAGAANFVALQSRIAPRSYVAASIKLNPGVDLFSADNVTKFEAAAEIPAALPWSDRKVLFGLPASRELLPGDLLLRRDVVLPEERLTLQPNEVALNISLEGVRFESNLLRVGRSIGFAVSPSAEKEADTTTTVAVPDTAVALGPFRIVSIGEQISASESLVRPGQKGLGSSGLTISVATKLSEDRSFDAVAAQLLRANKEKTILALVVYAPPPPLEPTKSSGSKPSEADNK